MNEWTVAQYIKGTVQNHVIFNLWNICFLDYLLFLIAFSYLIVLKKQKKEKASF
jgi:hypothetical protein